MVAGFDIADRPRRLLGSAVDDDDVGPVGEVVDVGQVFRGMDFGGSAPVHVGAGRGFFKPGGRAGGGMGRVV